MDTVTANPTNSCLIDDCMMPMSSSQPIPLFGTGETGGQEEVAASTASKADIDKKWVIIEY